VQTLWKGMEEMKPPCGKYYERHCSTCKECEDREDCARAADLVELASEEKRMEKKYGA